jgi:DNA-binding IclR family transcriptional regulator
MAKDAAVNASARFVFSVLRLAAAADAPLSVAEISRRLGVSVNKAYRAAVTLEGAGYLHRDPNTGRFETGPVTEQLVYAAFEQFQIRAAIAPYLRQIATSAQATTSLAVRIGWYGVGVALIESGGNIVSRAQRLGRATLLDRDPGGLAILAWLTANEVTQFKAFAATHPSGPNAAGVSSNQLATIRKSGFALSAPNDTQLHALGIPVREGEGRPIASITIQAPGGRRVPLQADPLLKDWLGTAAQAEAMVRASPTQFVNPYAFLDPDLLRFSDR